MKLQPQEKACESCSSTIKWYTAAQSRHLYCSKCGQYHEVNKKGELQKKTAGTPKIKGPAYTFKPGDVITLDRIAYTVIGSTWKEDMQYPEFKWKEYTLFNDEAGYRWLSESMGHWILLTELDAVPIRRSSDTVAIFNEVQYDVFQKSRSNTIHAAGEFSSMPLVRGARYQEYIAPPSMLSVEITTSGHTWFKGQHISKKEVAAAGNIESDKLPVQDGVGAVEPFGSAVRQDITIAIAAIAVGLMLIVMMISSSMSDDRMFMADSSQADSTGKITTQSFDVTQSGALRLRYEADCYNNWSEAEVDIINDATGESQGTIIGAEYYAGSDSEGSWSEGSTSSEQYVSSVPAGKYHLVITPFRGTANASGTKYQLTLEQNATIGSNFFSCALLIILAPVVQYFRRRSFESRRWSSSDFSPYSFNEEE